MTTQPTTKAEIIEQLTHAQQRIAQILAQTPAEQLNVGTPEAWSAADYVKHLLITIKPIAKAMSMPPENLAKMFGEADHPSRSYADVVASYQEKIAAGLRAEDAGDMVLPMAYRYPEGVTVGDVASETVHLVDAWNATQARIVGVIAAYDDAELDKQQLPHPALGLLTLREMLFFTVYHTTLHADDIEQAAAKTTA